MVTFATSYPLPSKAGEENFLRPREKRIQPNSDFEGLSEKPFEIRNRIQRNFESSEREVPVIGRNFFPDMLKGEKLRIKKDNDRRRMLYYLERLNAAFKNLMRSVTLSFEAEKLATQSINTSLKHSMLTVSKLKEEIRKTSNPQHRNKKLERLKAEENRIEQLHKKKSILSRFRARMTNFRQKMSSPLDMPGTPDISRIEKDMRDTMRQVPEFGNAYYDLDNRTRNDKPSIGPSLDRGGYDDAYTPPPASSQNDNTSPQAGNQNNADDSNKNKKPDNSPGPAAENN